MSISDKDLGYPRATWALPVFVTAENWRDQAGDVEATVAAVIHAGVDPIAAENLIRYFHFALEDGQLFCNCSGLGEVERSFIDYVGHAFGRYVAGRPIGAAFGLDRGRGDRERADLTDRNTAIAAAVEQLVRRDLTVRQSVNRESVCREVASRFNIGWKSVEKIYVEYRHAMSLLADAEIAALVLDLTKSP